MKKIGVFGRKSGFFEFEKCFSLRVSGEVRGERGKDEPAPSRPAASFEMRRADWPPRPPPTPFATHTRPAHWPPDLVMTSPSVDHQ